MATISKLSGSGVIKAPNGAVSIKRSLNSGIPDQAPQGFNSDIRTNPQGTTGWTGMKFPFQFTDSGSVAVSTTTKTDFSHIIEAVEQILLTRKRERFMQPEFGSTFKDLVFELPHDIESSLKFKIITDLETQEPRIAVFDVVATQRPYSGGVAVDITLYYGIKSYSPSVTVTHTIAMAQ